MACASASLIAKPDLFPHLRPELPRPYPTPLPKRGGRLPTRIPLSRDIWREMDDLSEEENDLEDMTDNIRNRGYTWLIPMGRTLTQQEEKNDV